MHFLHWHLYGIYQMVTTCAMLEMFLFKWRNLPEVCTFNDITTILSLPLWSTQLNCILAIKFLSFLLLIR